MVKDDAGAEEVVVDADEVRKLRVQDHSDPFFPQSQSFLLQTHFSYSFTTTDLKCDVR